MAVQAQFPLCGSQDWMDNGCGVGFNHFGYSYLNQPQHQQLLQFNTSPFQNQQFKNQNLGFHPTTLYDSSSSSSCSSIPCTQTMAAYQEKQRQELDHYIKLQNERLRLLMQEQRKQQIASLMKKIESKALPLLRNKDEEIAQAAKRTVELEEFLKRLEIENQAWQRVAQENEAMVVSLNTTIEQLREKASSCSDNGAEDAESCCDLMNRQEEGEETEQINRGYEHNNVTTEEKKKMVCGGCNRRNSCILFLPCRHLCSCKACEAFLDCCPLCLTEKKASIEALIV